MGKIVKHAMDSRGQCWPLVMPSCTLDKKISAEEGQLDGSIMRSLCSFPLLR